MKDSRPEFNLCVILEEINHYERPCVKFSHAAVWLSNLSLWQNATSHEFTMSQDVGQGMRSFIQGLS